jgi:hypothetical protein
MQLLNTLLLSLFYMFRALFAHHQELTKTVRAAYSDDHHYKLHVQFSQAPDDGREVPETCRTMIIIKCSKVASRWLH